MGDGRTSLKSRWTSFRTDGCEILLENQEVAFVSAQVGRADTWSEPFPPSRVELMVGPKPHESWTRVKNKRELIDQIGARLREKFPTSRFNFTQPIIDMVTQDTNGASVKLAVELSGKDSETLLSLARETLSLARETLQLLKTNPDALDALYALYHAGLLSDFPSAIAQKAGARLHLGRIARRGIRGSVPFSGGLRTARTRPGAILKAASRPRPLI